MTKECCYICQTTESELRPYGVNFAYVCFDCMTSSLELENEAKKNFSIMLAATGPITVIGGQDGPSSLGD